MKLFKNLLICLIISITFSLTLSSCVISSIDKEQQNTVDTPNKEPDISNVTFQSETIVYDNQLHSIYVQNFRQCFVYFAQFIEYFLIFVFRHSKSPYPKLSKKSDTNESLDPNASNPARGLYVRS